MAKHQMRPRQTVSGWLERVRQEELARPAAMKQGTSSPPPTLVGRMAHTADVLAGRVKQLEKELEQAELQVLYYQTVIRVAEQELGVAIEKKSATPPSSSCS